MVRRLIIALFCCGLMMGCYKKVEKQTITPTEHTREVIREKPDVVIHQDSSDDSRVVERRKTTVIDNY